MPKLDELENAPRCYDPGGWAQRNRVDPELARDAAAWDIYCAPSRFRARVKRIVQRHCIHSGDT